jgi:Cu(I)/Ag(I) efflux system membrane fusion protein
LLSAEREYLNILMQTNMAASMRLAQEHEKLVMGARERLRRLGLTDDAIGALSQKSVVAPTTEILAPISGTIISRSAFEGQYVKEGDKLLEIADLSTLWFRFEVYEQDLSWIRPDEIVHIQSPGLGSNTLSGPIAFINPNINDVARVARMRVELENPDGKLFNGLYAEGVITVKSPPVLAVARSAVLDPGDFPRVYVDNGGGAYEARKVRIGRKGSAYWEVLEGLEEGEVVVTNGNLLLDSQAQINQAVHPAEHSHGEKTETTP